MTTLTFQYVKIVWQKYQKNNGGSSGSKFVLSWVIIERLSTAIVIDNKEVLMFGKIFSKKPKKPKWEIGLHSSAQERSEITAAWVLYASIKIRVREGSYVDDHPESRGMDSQFDEESFARDHMAEFWAEQSAEVQSINPYLELLVKIREAGLIREYVWRYMRAEDWQNQTGLSIDKLDELMTAENEETHQVVTLAQVIMEE